MLQIYKLQDELKNKDKILKNFISKEIMKHINKSDIYDQLQIQDITKLQVHYPEQSLELKFISTSSYTFINKTLSLCRMISLLNLKK